MEEILQKTYQFAQQYHSTDTSGHDFEHIKRVCKNVDTLLKEVPQANAFILKMSSLLHDIDDHKLGSDGYQTERFLKSLPLSDTQIAQILATINAIGFSSSGAHPHFDTIEQALLSDADKLDAMGAIGICRTIMYNAHTKRPLFRADKFPQKDLTSAEYKNLNRDTNTAINHFFDKLLKLKNAMQTKAGKKEAAKRHKFMVLFLTEFFEEQNNNDWLDYLKMYLEEVA